MACENQDPGTFDQILQPGLGLPQEVGVHGADAFVEQQDLWVDAGDHAHRQADSHPGGIGAQRHRKVLAQFGEFGDLIHFRLHLFAGLSQKQPTNDDVLVAGDLGVHADAQIEDRRHPSGDLRPAAGGLVDARKQA
ncbi:Uncharacterised protein [Mycobacterium tuberculosis]|nr:Uncharacterised protein [Mycobacterium tuberculosis]